MEKKDFDVKSLDDEIRVDGLCKELLMRFYEKLLQDGASPEDATSLASGADYFLRDFVVGIKQANILEERPGIVRQFAGNWYIVNTLEPNSAELGKHLSGVAAFYRFLNSEGHIGDGYLAMIEDECSDRSFYEERIDSFWEISGDGYFEWEQSCSLKDR